jgi:hypothetical protein
MMILRACISIAIQIQSRRPSVLLVSLIESSPFLLKLDSALGIKQLAMKVIESSTFCDGY